MFDYRKELIKFEDKLEVFVLDNSVREMRTSVRGVGNDPKSIGDVSEKIEELVSKYSGLQCSIKSYATPRDMHATVYPTVTKTDVDGLAEGASRVTGSGEKSFYTPLPDGEGGRFVYVVRCCNYHKIGVSDDPDKRFKSIQAHNPFEIELVKVYGYRSSDAHKIERYLHKQFNEYRVRGEWFDFGDLDVIKLIDSALC